MDKEYLLNLLKEKKDMFKKLEIAYLKLDAQIILLEEILKKIEEESKENNNVSNNI